MTKTRLPRPSNGRPARRGTLLFTAMATILGLCLTLGLWHGLS